MRKYLWAGMMAVLASGLVLYLTVRLPHRPIELAWTTTKTEDPAKVEVTQPLLVLPKPPKFIIEPFAPIELVEPVEPAPPPVVKEEVVPLQGTNPQPPRFYMPYADEVEKPTAFQSLWNAVTDIVERVRTGKAVDRPDPDSDEPPLAEPPAQNNEEVERLAPQCKNDNRVDELRKCLIVLLKEKMYEEAKTVAERAQLLDPDSPTMAAALFQVKIMIALKHNRDHFSDNVSGGFRSLNSGEGSASDSEEPPLAPTANRDKKEVESREQFWRDYYEARTNQEVRDHNYWAQYYKNHGCWINGIYQRIQISPVFVAQQMNWAVPNPEDYPSAPSGFYNARYNPPPDCTTNKELRPIADDRPATKDIFWISLYLYHDHQSNGFSNVEYSEGLWREMYGAVTRSYVASFKDAQTPPELVIDGARAPCAAANPCPVPSRMPYADDQPLPWESPLEGCTSLIRGWVRPLGVPAVTVSRTRQLEPETSRMPYADEEPGADCPAP